VILWKFSSYKIVYDIICRCYEFCKGWCHILQLINYVSGALCWEISSNTGFNLREVSYIMNDVPIFVGKMQITTIFLMC
jgi:hypothetical protein